MWYCHPVQSTEVVQLSLPVFTVARELHVGDEEDNIVEDAVTILLPHLPPIRTTPPDYTLARGQPLIKFILSWILFLLSFPYVVAFTWTIPECSKNRKLYVITSSFLASVLWIAALSFVLVVLLSHIGCILSIMPFITGLVLVATAVSIPVSKKQTKNEAFDYDENYLFKL